MRSALIAAVLVLALAGGAAAQAPYDDVTPEDSGTDGWMEDVNDTTVSTIADMIGRVGTFVIGSNPARPMAGPIMTGLIVGGVVVGLVGSSRAGVVSGGVMGIATLAVLATSAAFIPMWVYGVALMLLGIMAAAVARRLFR